MRFMLAAALVGAKRTSELARLYRSAVDLVGQIRQSGLLDRTIAVASNDLGWELYETLSRTVSEDALMQLCAEMSLKYWLKCGDWINEERALLEGAGLECHRQLSIRLGRSKQSPLGHQFAWRTPARCRAPPPRTGEVACRDW